MVVRGSSLWPGDQEEQGPKHRAISLVLQLAGRARSLLTRVVAGKRCLIVTSRSRYVSKLRPAGVFPRCSPGRG